MNIVLSGFRINKLDLFLKKFGIVISNVTNEDTILVLSAKKTNLTYSSPKIKMAHQLKIPIFYINL